MESFFAGACTWQKILLSLQVWNLFAFSEQIMRAADCKPFIKKGFALFDNSVLYTFFPEKTTWQKFAFTPYAKPEK